MSPDLLPQRVRIDVDVDYVLYFLSQLGIVLTLVGLGLAGGYAFAIGVVMDASAFEALPADVRQGFQGVFWFALGAFIVTTVITAIREWLLVTAPSGTQFIAPEKAVDVQPLPLELVEDPRAPDDIIPDDVEVRRLGPAVKREDVDELREGLSEEAEVDVDGTRQSVAQDGGEN